VIPEDCTWSRRADAPDRIGDGVVLNSVKRERPLAKRVGTECDVEGKTERPNRRYEMPTVEPINIPIKVSN
jgi:hypothetical protein